MTSDLPTTSETRAGTPPTDLTGVARKIRRRTTDLLGIGIVTIGCLTVASYVSEAWRTDTPPVAPPAHSTGWDPAAGTILQFGSMRQSLHQQIVHGSRDEALAQLAGNCQSAAGSARAALADNAREAPAEEQRLLELLATREPDEVLPDGRQRHKIDGLLPMIVVAGTPAIDSRQIAVSTDAAPSRVLSWGIALPVDEASWSLLTLQPTDSTGADTVSHGPIPLPPDGERTLDITGHDGGRLLCFRGPGPGRRWVRELDRQFLQQRWQPLRPWSQSGHGGWSATYSQRDETGRTRADIQLARQPDGNWVGVLQILPPHE